MPVLKADTGGVMAKRKPGLLIQETGLISVIRL